MSLELCGRRVPAVSLGVALCAHSVCVTVVVELLCDVPAEDLLDEHVTV